MKRNYGTINVNLGWPKMQDIKLQDSGCITSHSVYALLFCLIFTDEKQS